MKGACNGRGYGSGAYLVGRKGTWSLWRLGIWRCGESIYSFVPCLLKVLAYSIVILITSLSFSFLDGDCRTSAFPVTSKS